MRGRVSHASHAGAGTTPWRCRDGIAGSLVALLLGVGCAASPAQAPGAAPEAAEPSAASTSPGACAPLEGTERPLIDDFEPTQGTGAGAQRRPLWFQYDDGTSGTLRREEVEVQGREENGRVLHASSSGFVRWGAGFGATLHPQSSPSRACAYDASAYTGVRLRVRGRGRLHLSFADPTSTPTDQGGTCQGEESRCYDRPGVWLHLTEEWRTVEYPFCAFTPAGWGGTRDPLDPSQLMGLHFVAGPRETMEAWLDDVAFYEADPGQPPPACGPVCPLDAVPASAVIDPAATTAPLNDELRLYTLEQPTKSCGSLMRRYLTFVPERLPAKSSAPVLIMLHGSSANAESARTFMARDRFDALAKRDGFIVVYGNAAPGAHTSPEAGFPNTGAWRQGFFDDGLVDEVDYVERVLGDMKSRGTISGDNPVLLTGISNGGGMVLELARRLSPRIHGVAAIMPYDGEQPNPVPNLANTPLRRVLFIYTLDDPGMAPRYHETLAPLPAEWAQAMGIPEERTANPTKTALPNRVVEGADYEGASEVARATLNSQVTQLDRMASETDAHVRVLLMDKAGHFWPNPTQDSYDWVLERWGFRNQDIDAADVVWEFLRPRAK